MQPPPDPMPELPAEPPAFSTAVPPPWVPPDGWAPQPAFVASTPAPPRIAYVPTPSVPLGGYGGRTAPAYGVPLRPPVVGPTPAVAFTVQAVGVTGWQRAGAAFAAFGAAVVTLGTFLPWYVIDVLGYGRRAGNGWNNLVDDRSWGPTLLILAVAAAVSVAPTIAGMRWSVPRVAAIGAGVLLLGTVGYQFVDILGGRPGISVTIEGGPFVMMSGSLMVFIGAVLTARRSRPANVTPPRAVGAVG
ncbi:MAG: hypothetical protein U0Q22_18670 [Acidimicrobiales bacterium]